MKKYILILIVCLLATACGGSGVSQTSNPETTITISKLSAGTGTVTIPLEVFGDSTSDLSGSSIDVYVNGLLDMEDLAADDYYSSEDDAVVFDVTDLVDGDVVEIRITLADGSSVAYRGTVSATADAEASLVTTDDPWIRSVTSNNSEFSSVDTDDLGNIYAVGSIIVKYDSAGNAQWAKSVVADSSSYFASVTVDASGNIYAAGFISGTGTHDFGDGVTVSGTSEDENAVIVKYNSAGTTQWAKSVVLGDDESGFNGISSDTSGNVYAVGYIWGTGAYNFGNDVESAGTSTLYNLVIVKYNAAGEAQWAKSVSAEVGLSSKFNGVTVDASDNVYAVGQFYGCYGSGVYDFGNDVEVSGARTSCGIAIVKYNSAGEAQWAKSSDTEIGGGSFEEFSGVSVDSTGNVYAVGEIISGTFNLGNGVEITGSDTELPTAVIVKYDVAGDAQWAVPVITTGESGSTFYGVAVDPSNNVYAVGHLFGTGSQSFGNGITASGEYQYQNAVMVEYNNEGEAQWIHAVTGGNDSSEFLGISADSYGNVTVVGTIEDNETYNFGDDLEVAGTAVPGDTNAVIVKNWIE